jgi:hypothetical protein
MLAGILCLSIGITVLIGWYAHIPILFQVHPDLTPMYFNTALNFILLGGGFLTLLLAYKKCLTTGQFFEISHARSQV